MRGKARDEACSLSNTERRTIQEIQRLVSQYGLDDMVKHIDAEFLSKSLLSMAMQILYIEFEDLDKADTLLRRFMFEYWPVAIEEVELVKFVSSSGFDNYSGVN